MTLPVVVILGLVFGLLVDKGGSGSSSPKALPALTPIAPPPDAAAAAPCTKLLEHLPIHLGKLAPRVVHPKPDSRFVLAWGDPAVILRCGVSRPADLHPGSSAQFISGSVPGKVGPFYDVTSAGDVEIYTTVDRAVYVQISLPSKYQGATYLPIFSKAIDAAMPPVCVGGQPAAGKLPPSDRLCTHRK